MTSGAFRGWTSCKILMQQGGVLVCYYFAPKGAADVSLHDENHNIFRLDANGNVIWQVKRDEQGKLNWESMNKHAIEDGFDGARWPFVVLSIEYLDGTNNYDKQTGTPPNVDVWKPGCKIYSSSAQGQTYEIDTEQGIARNVTVGRQRPW